MKSKILSLTLFICFLLLNLCSYSQDNSPNVEFQTLDNSYFKWKEFSFIQTWEKVKIFCQLQKIEQYNESYQDYYFGQLSPTNKSYYILSRSYQEFDGYKFDHVILNMIGSFSPNLNYNSIYFIKQLSDSTTAKSVYTRMLHGFKSKYGNCLTELIEKNKEEGGNIDSVIPPGIKKYLGEKDPFSKIEITEWWGAKNIYMQLTYVQESNLIFLSVKEFHNRTFYHKINWFRDSEYDEQFTTSFKEFDNSNGYKDLKFGMQMSAIKKVISLQEMSELREYYTTMARYKYWFSNHFDNCVLTFNKKDQLYDVTLFKNEITDDEYQKLLNDLIEMLGNPTRFKEPKVDMEVSYWWGKKITLYIMRHSTLGLFVDFNRPTLDDSAKSDKLY